MGTEQDFQVLGTLAGADELKRLLRRAPNVYRRFVIRGLVKERNSFIGKPARQGGTSGVWRRKLERKKLWGDRISAKLGENKWSRAVASQFKGYIDAKDWDNEMTLHMGMTTKNYRDIHRALLFLGKGGTLSSKGGYMIVPIPRNIRNIITAQTGMKLKTGQSNKLLRSYSQMQTSEGHSRIVPIRVGGKLRFYDRETLDQGRALSALLFIGVRSVRVKKQYDFERDWKRREPKALNRIGKQVDKATKLVQAGKV